MIILFVLSVTNQTHKEEFSIVKIQRELQEQKVQKEERFLGILGE